MRDSSRLPEASVSPLGGGGRPWRVRDRQIDTPCKESLGIEFIYWVMEGKRKGKERMGEWGGRRRERQKLPLQKKDRQREREEVRDPLA